MAKPRIARSARPIVVSAMISVLFRSSVRVRAWQARPFLSKRVVSHQPGLHYHSANDRPFLCHYRQSTRHLASDNDDNTPAPPAVSTMDNLYTEWTLEHDQLLWKHHRESTTAELAALLGRGLRGVESRLEKLKDVDSAAYERLFANKQSGDNETRQKNTDDDEFAKKEKLVPAGEILRRIQWDYTLSTSDFSILHYDRVEDSVMESPLDAPNDNIQGSGELLIYALPEHRIVAIKYRERVVWDREQRMDLVFSNEGIESVIANYDEWKASMDAQEEWMRLRRGQVDAVSESMLGLEKYHEFWAVCETFKSNLEEQPVGFSIKKETETYVKSAMNLFHQAYYEKTGISLDSNQRHKLDLEILDLLSELAAVSPNEDFRSFVLEELQIVLCRLEGKPLSKSLAKVNNQQLPDISEDDITESFVKGGGSGGQKVNKTSSKVVLLHNPTNIRVECQDTRSLQQNRKIARKRLRIKLDEFFNGSQSKASLKAEKASSKKAKAKARSRKRNQKKSAAKKEAKN